MHEALLAKKLLSVALERAREAGALRITKVSGWIADTEALTVEALQFHFAAHAKGTAAAEARLDLKLTHVSARCKTCGNEYHPDHHVTLCPNCESVDSVLVGQEGVGLETLEFE